jgi:nitrite reductase/ring-hydroxylating ferredoxin subunit
VDRERGEGIREESRTPSPQPHVGTYRRRLPVTLERLYENALDWEHLPYLHRSTFCDIELLEADASRWRARVGLQPAERRTEVVLELRLEPEKRRWITSTLAGLGEGTEIWTHAFTVGEQQIDVVVDFFVPGIPPEAAAGVGVFYRELYAHLYDEDVRMMTERQARLDQRKQRAAPGADRIALGALQALRPRLPLLVELGGERFRLVDVGGELLAHSVVCPHLLGPLADSAVVEGVIECPWHGYRFALRTGENLSGHACRLGRAPVVRIDPVTSEVTVGFERGPRSGSA